MPTARPAAPDTAPAPTPTPDITLFEALRAGFPRALDAIAITQADGPDAGAAYSWRDLERGSAMMANLLAGLQLSAGSRVAVQVDKSVEALMLYLAVLRAGLVYLPLNIAYREDEMAYFIGNARPAVVVCAPAHFAWVSRLAFVAGAQAVYTLGERRDGTLLERAAHCSDRCDSSAAPPQRPAPAAAAADAAAPADLAAIVYTSGTTGRSKGAMLTQGNLLSNARVLQHYWDWQRGDEPGADRPVDTAPPDSAPPRAAWAQAQRRTDVLIHALPIFHVHGLFVALHGALLNGSPMIWFNRFDAAAVVAQLPRATVFMGVPTLYTRLLAEPGLTREACAGMRLFISGSAPLLPDTFDAWQARTGHVILERYGMSETVMLTSNPCRAADGERRRGTVGPALPGVGLRIVDDTGQACASGAIGQVQVQGPNVFAGYWQMPEKTAEDFAVDARGQRWFKTGDVGQLSADGYLTLVGRSKDLIISGGYNVYPAEIESLLNEQPGVAESAVIGVPHADFGEGVVALLVARPGATLDADALAAALKPRLANFKQPKRILVVDALPRNAMGKVQKALLREQHQGLLA